MSPRHLARVAITAMTFAALDGCGKSTDADGGTSSTSACTSYCDKQGQVGCPGAPADCTAECEARLAAAPGCEGEFAAAFRCAASRPVSEFICEQGQARLPEGTCASESSSAATCAEGGGGPQGAAEPDLGKGCALGGTCTGDLECLDAETIGGPVCSRSCDTDADCPENGVCLVFDANDGHYCAARCASSADCEPLVPGAGLSCKPRSEISTETICGN